ncbi:MAG: 50S ribosomal protein L3 [candidate division FCPU426 bacterium]
MLQGIIGKKIGMTQIFLEDGKWIPVTVIQAGPCKVVRAKSKSTDGYEAVQLGFEEVNPKRVAKPLLGQFTKRSLKPYRVLSEFRVTDSSQYTIGQDITVDSIKDLQWVDVSGTSIGKGFQGVFKRHNFHGGANTHGSMHHRQPGSMGASSRPSRVFKNHKLAGHMGDAACTCQKLKVVSVDTENNLLLVRGAVPGGKRAIVFIKKSKKA